LLEESFGILTDRLKVQNLEGEKLLFERNSEGPSSVDVPVRKVMRSWRSIQQELHND